MKRLIVATLMGVTLLTAIGTPAQAVPRYGSQHTGLHGWTVWASNNMSYPIRSRCTWDADGRSWVASWRLRAWNGYQWTTSDAGGWGDFRPQNLHCTYHRAF
jgi:hypothetical protein